MHRSFLFATGLGLALGLGLIFASLSMPSENPVQVKASAAQDATQPVQSVGVRQPVTPPTEERVQARALVTHLLQRTDISSADRDQLEHLQRVLNN